MRNREREGEEVGWRADEGTVPPNLLNPTNSPNLNLSYSTNQTTIASTYLSIVQHSSHIF